MRATAPSPELAARIALAAGVFLFVFLISTLRLGYGSPDFYVFWDAARHWREPYGATIAAEQEARTHLVGVWPFVYPPTLLVILWPFGQLPLALAYPLWTGLSAAAFTYAAAHLVRPAWLTLALFVAPPVGLAVSLGQTSLLVGAAMIGGWLALKHRPALAGVLFALAACVKPQAMILAPLLLWGHWRAARWALIAGLCLVLASFAFGPALWLEWPRAMAGFVRLLPRTDRINPSALAPWLALPLAGLGAFVAWRSRDPAGLVAGALCLTPYAHQYDLVPLAPIALRWLVGYRTDGYGRAILGGAVLAGLVASPWAGLAFVAALAALVSPWWPKRTPPPYPSMGKGEDGVEALA